MKRLASRLTWWPTRPHKSTPAVNAAERRGRVQLTFTMPEHDEFSVELTLLSQDRLFGLGGLGSITTGFELHRPQ